MKYPNFNEEKKLWKKGYKYVVGLDEAGRGPLAGPVVAGAVIIKNLKSILNEPIFKKVKDSKMLSAEQREEIYNYFKKNSGIEWGIGIVSEKVIDKINILEATKLAMEKAIKDLELSFPRKRESMVGLSKLWIPSQAGNDTMKVEYLLIDGNFKINSLILQKSIAKADQKVFSCALASIFAKVTRDGIMQKEHKKYPKYGFNQHKGYGTDFHFKMLKKHGPCKIHRKSFYPMNIFA